MDPDCQTGKTITDFLTGRPAADTGEELVRQATERLLVEEKGYDPAEIEVDRPFEIVLDGRRHQGRAELVVFVKGRPFMAIKNAPGSLVSREREALAASRLAFDPPAPLTVVTNRKSAEIIETATGKVLGEGLESIPDKDEAGAWAMKMAPTTLKEGQREKEGRIYLAFGDFQCPLKCK